MKPFERWTFEDVEETFDMKRIKNHPVLTDWLNAQFEGDDYVTNRLEVLKNRLIDNVESWNEEELKYQFLGLLMDLVGMDNEKYKAFLGRKLSANVNGEILSGNVDFVIATGKVEPKHPFFFIHEYKQEKKKDNDPLGQLLVAMVAAQIRNNDNRPIYGSYIVGRLWFFVCLIEKEYSVSLAYDATQDDLSNIYAILKQANRYILEYFKGK
ncbi:hypothetical protein LV89_00315 [Arcicella aurantiaca]|uniref:Uncharacterized protein n=1 Tax=Arcicella aurantiaca TaxID=591202 RepID=A0A316EGM5_9BACT|nr:hypothetical protein [Arcicella aurantiaca]PWK29475.1 hypothetical protein LV89_00315 [Arcicella aurantiaca]